MSKKIFVSYKHKDDSVHLLQRAPFLTTARHYVDELMDIFAEEGEIFKGEGNEDLSEFKIDTIRTKLKDKIYDSSITIVLISPNMKNLWGDESSQWIPWEVSYSLKKITRDGRASHPNAMLAVVLPDASNSYSYCIEDLSCGICQTIKRDFLFKILAANMNNLKHECRVSSACPIHPNHPGGELSYILFVKWSDFVRNKDHYICRATTIQNNILSYNLTKEIPDDWRY